MTETIRKDLAELMLMVEFLDGKKNYFKVDEVSDQVGFFHWGGGEIIQQAKRYGGVYARHGEALALNGEPSMTQLYPPEFFPLTSIRKMKILKMSTDELSALLALHAVAEPQNDKWHGFIGGLNGKPEFCKFCGEPEQSYRHAHAVAEPQVQPTRFTEQANPQDVSLSEQVCDECGGTFMFLHCQDGDCSNQEPNYCPLCGRYSIPARMAGKIAIPAAHAAEQPDRKRMMDSFDKVVPDAGTRNQIVNCILGVWAAEQPKLTADEQETLLQIRERSKDDYASVGDEQDGFAAASLDVAWLLDFVVPAALLTSPVAPPPQPICRHGVAGCPECKTGIFTAPPVAPGEQPPQEGTVARALKAICRRRT